MADDPIPVLDLRAQYRSIRAEIQDAINRVLDSQHFILGPEVKALEEEIAAYCGTKHAVGLASGTDAILLALAATGIKEGDEVITTPFTFVATADTITLLRAVPVFADIDPATFNIDPALIEARITPRTKAILPVHLYGQSADMEPILRIARRYGLRVIEDNAQAIGATYRGNKTASLGDAGTLSFFPSKNLGGYGDGGMVVTNSDEIAERVRRLRAHGASKKYFSEEQGYNSRLDEIQAAVLRVKLRHLDAWIARRRANAAKYTALLESKSAIRNPQSEMFSAHSDNPQSAIRNPQSLPVVPPVEAAYATHVYHQYTVRLPNRDAAQAVLKARKIGSMVYYPIPLHLQPMFAGRGLRAGDLPESERASAECLSLPMFPELTDEQIARVAAALAETRAA
jgi:dTDP-4-amino-4,6-dideoxygalactose transaminase